MSPPDPLRDAAAWLDAKLAGAAAPRLLLVIGLGDGSLLDVLEARAPDTKVLALEPDSAATLVFRARRDWTRWLESGRLMYLVGPDFAGAEQAWRMFPATAEPHVVLTHPSIEARPTAAAVEAARVLKKILFGARANAAARRTFAPIYLVNALRNLPSLVRGGDLRSLVDAYRSVPAVITGAGPSLDRSIPDLREVAERALIIATDTTLRPLLHAGITPPLGVGLDPTTANAQHYRLLPDTSRTWLACETALDPSAIAPFDDRTFWFRVSPHHPWPWFNEMGLDVGRIEVWASVLTAAFQVAVLAGCDPIVFVGADLAFTEGRPYCRGSANEFEWALTTAKGEPLQVAWDFQMTRREPVQHADVAGGQTITTSTLIEVRDWLAAHAPLARRRVINATGAGILSGGGIEQVSSLKAAIGTGTPVPPVSARWQPQPVKARDVEQQVDAVRTAFRAGTALPGSVGEWAAFCGDGYSPDAVARALDEAAQRLAGNRDPRADAPLAPLLSLAAAASASVIDHLPEAIGRQRAAAICAPELPARAGAAATSTMMSGERLSLAFELLCAFWPAALDVPDLPEPVPGTEIGGPIAQVCRWPTELTWAAQVFEALLGDSWTRPLPPDARSFVPSGVRAPQPGPPAGDTTADDHPNTTAACAHFAIAWLMTAVNEARLPIHPLLDALTVVRRLAAAYDTAVGPSDDGATIALRVDAPGRSSQSIALPLPARERVLAGLALWIVHSPGAFPLPLMRLDFGGGVTVALELNRPIHSTAAAAGPEPRILAERPRVLTEEFMARCAVAYAADDGVVVAPIVDGRLSFATFTLREDGSAVPRDTWPRGVTLSLPFGENGVVAWTQQLTPAGGSVMYRSAPGAEVHVVDLPFSPTIGAWFEGRLYWTCWPSGIGSWAPGEDPTFERPELSLCGIRSEDGALWLDPWVVEDGVPQRQLQKTGWRWLPGQDPEPVALGPLGSESCRSTRDGWTASSHPDADVVRLRSADGAELALPCAFPFRVAWAGRSLLVASLNGDLLLFERLLDRLSA